MKLLAIMLAVVLVPIILYLAFAFLISNRKLRCPGCNQRGLQLDLEGSVLGGRLDERGQRVPYSVSAYRCMRCQSEWRSYNQGGLMTKEAFDAGAVEPIPTATVRRDR